MTSWKYLVAALLSISGIAAGASAMAGPEGEGKPLVIEAQGSFAAGGTVVGQPGTYDNDNPTAAGQTLHGDHLYAFYQIPQDPRPLPIVMLHGAFQSARSWGDHAGWPRGVPQHLPEAAFPGLPCRSAAPRPGRQQHRRSDDRADALRPALLRPVPYRQVARLLRQRPVRSQSGDAEPVPARGDAEHRAL